MLLSQAVTAMLAFRRRAKLGHVHRGKDLPALIADREPDLGKIVKTESAKLDCVVTERAEMVPRAE